MSIRLDYLPDKEKTPIYQDSEMFCINTDTMVLGDFIKINHKDIVLEIGTNNGALLLYANKFKPKKLIGIDINKKALEVAKKNMELHNIDNVELYCIDGKEFRYKEEVDIVIFNPPYFKTPSLDKGKNEHIALAKHEDNFPLKEMMKCINRNLRVNGKLFFLFQTSRLSEVINELNNIHFSIKEMQFVYDENKDYSTVVLIKAVKGSKEGMNVLKPRIITR